MSANLPITTLNKFSVLSQDSTPSSTGEPIFVQALVHRPSTPTLPANKFSGPPVTLDTTVMKRKDSQGKELGSHLKGLEIEFQVFVHSSTGAKLKIFVNNGLRFVKDLTKNDLIGWFKRLK